MSYLWGFWTKIKTNPKKSAAAIAIAIGAGAEALGYHGATETIAKILDALSGLF